MQGSFIHINSKKFSNATFFRQIALQNLQRKNLGFSEAVIRSRIVTRPYLLLSPHYLLRARTEIKLVPFVVDNTLQHSATLLLIPEKEGIFSGDKVVAIFA